MNAHGKKDKRTYRDRRKYLINTEYKGDCCQLCGYNKYFESLEFHQNPNEKNFNISSKGHFRS
mgnify:CR=1 FL=1